MRVLVIEDERGLAEGLQALLTKNGYAVDLAFDGIAGLDGALCGFFDLILLDIMLPKLSGLEVLASLRRQSIATPVILLTAKSEVEDKITGLDCGADDYLTKPFDPGELLARVRAATRRTAADFVDTDLIFEDLRLCAGRQELSCGGGSIRLGAKEYQLMECLMRNQNQIVPKDTLWEKAWGLADESEYNNVEVYLSFLRKKLLHLHSGVQIKVTRGVGYSLERGSL